MAKKNIIKLIDQFVDEKIIVENLEDIVGSRFGRYSKYIIQDRALPDVRDGLKPVQRRILFSMYKLGMFSNKPYKKSARIVGDVIGKYHPHGDSSVYDAMVRLSQTWKIRIPLIDMHGNNGSVDGDSAAAMRYTEARMSAASEFLLQDIEKRTVDFIPNFDDEEYEPTVLPARYPNLLANGASGISAGYATDIPPHNVREVIRAVIKRISSPDMTVEDVLKIVKGPDFPTGAIVQGKGQIEQAFATGKGRIIVKSKCEIIDQSIIVTELPYEVNKATLVRKIDDIRIKKQVNGIAEVRDESDREGLRVAIDVKKGINPEFILNYLHKKTDLTKSYNYNMVAINNKRPMLMGIIPIMDAYILHQKEVITNRSNYQLRRAQKRLHIVEGIIRMMDVLDDVIALIRSSKNKKDSKSKLMKKYDFSEEQAEAIIMLQLYRLSNTDITALLGEQSELNETVESLYKVLQNEDDLERVLVDELTMIMKKIKSPRKTQVEEEIEKITISEEELIMEEQVVVGISRGGYVKRSSIKSHRATDSPAMRDDDSSMFEKEVSTLNTILIFTNTGKYIYLPVYKIPVYKWKGLGTHISNIVQLKPEEFIVKILHVPSFKTGELLFFVTKKNLIKLTRIEDFEVSRYSKAVRAIALNKGDEVVAIDVAPSLHEEVLVISTTGLALRFNLHDVSLSSTIAKGVKAIGLPAKETLSTGKVLINNHELLLLTNKGAIKRVNLLDIPKKKRTNKGYQVLKYVKSNPVRVVDSVLMNSTQYKNRANIEVITNKQKIIINSFDVKSEQADNGKAFVKKKQGKPLFMSIENIEIDQTISQISDYVKDVTIEIEQQKLF